MTLAEAAQHCHRREVLPPDAIPAVVSALLDASVADKDKAAFLLALNEKGITSDDLVHFTRAILPHAVDPGFHGQWNRQSLFDCCGTGGGGLNILNVSTAIMFLLAAAGVPVVKHGNRGITKKSGSADVLEALGIKIDLLPDQLQNCLTEVGCTFLFAPAFHPAFKAVGPVRKQLAVEGHKTIFNLLGPLLNPCQPENQMVGVFDEEKIPLYSAALEQLGRKRYSVICGYDRAGNAVGEAVFGTKNTLHVQGREMGGASLGEGFLGNAQEIAVESSADSAKKIEAILRTGEDSIGSRMIEANAAVALLTCGKADDLRAALKMARETLLSGAAYRKLESWREFSASL